MINNDSFRRLALQFDNVEEHPHFHRKAFRIAGKKIFATLDETTNSANVVLSEVDQSVFCAFDKDVIYPVPNAWGEKGWTTIDLRKIKKPMLQDILTQAYKTASEKRKKA